jgi:hypothetical protein
VGFRGNIRAPLSTDPPLSTAVARPPLDDGGMSLFVTPARHVEYENPLDRKSKISQERCP